MPQDKKKSIKEFADEIRQNVADAGSMSDEDLVRQVIEAVPEAVSQIQTSERRQFMKPEGNAAMRFAKGAGSVFGEAAQNVGHAIANPPRGEGAGARTGPTHGPLPTNNSTLADTLKGAGKSAIDVPNIQKDIDRGDDAHAMGRSMTQGALAASGLSGLLSKMGVLSKGAATASSALGEMEAIGAETTKDAALAIAKRVSKPQSVILDKNIADISKAMQNEYIDAKRLSAGIAYAKKVIEKVSKAPGAQVKDVSAAKEAVARLSAKIKANPNIIPWNDAREALKELEQSAKTLGPSAAKNSVLEVAGALKGEIQTSATKAGQGAAYDKWVSDYASMSKWQRGYARVLNRQTQLQKETQLAAKDGASIGVPKTNLKLRLGKARADKIAEAHKSMIDKAHKGLEELDTKVKTPPPQAKPSAPTAGTPPPPAAPTPPPPQPAPQGGAPMPQAPAQGRPPIPGFGGTPAGVPRQGIPQPPIAQGQLGPMQQRIVEELKKLSQTPQP